jgi:hypothetical protein
MNLTAPSFPTDIVWAKDLVAWPTKIGDIVEAEIGKDELARLEENVRKERGINLPNMDKNALFIGFVMAEAWAEGKRFKTLEQLCKHIVTFAASVYPPPRQPAARATKASV